MDKESLKEEITNHVLRIVNKHHGDLQKNIAEYRRETKKLNEEIREFKGKIYSAVREFNDKHKTLPQKLLSVTQMINAHAIGVQRVYDRMTEIEKKIESGGEFYDFYSNLDPEIIIDQLKKYKEFLDNSVAQEALDYINECRDKINVLYHKLN